MIIIVSGFLEGIQPRNDKDIKIKEFTLMTLEKPGTYGAAYLGAKAADAKIHTDFSKNATVLYHSTL